MKAKETRAAHSLKRNVKQKRILQKTAFPVRKKSMNAKRLHLPLKIEAKSVFYRQK
jgi:hypothetical protein